MPMPTDDEQEPVEQLHVRFPRSLMSWLRVEAARRRRSANATLMQIVSDERDRHNEEGTHAQGDQ